MNKVKILFVIDQLSIGGYQKQLYYVLNNLDKSKFEIFLLYIKMGAKQIANYDVKYSWTC